MYTAEYSQAFADYYVPYGVQRTDGLFVIDDTSITATKERFNIFE